MVSHEPPSVYGTLDGHPQWLLPPARVWPRDASRPGCRPRHSAHIPHLPPRRLLQVCQRHFVQLVSHSPALAVATRRDAVMWLWRAHNEVGAGQH